MKSEEKELSERTLAFGNMTVMPRTMDKLPYHAPVTNGDIHPHSNGNKKKKKKTKSKSTQIKELREIIKKIISEFETDGGRLRRQL